jgi:predicted transcriptional regulator
VLVRLDAELVAMLDERATALGISRSELLRRAARSHLGGDAEAVCDRAIATGYARHPARLPTPLELSVATASIEQEPW